MIRVLEGSGRRRFTRLSGGPGLTGLHAAVAEQPHYRWKWESGVLRTNGAKRLQDLDKRNAGLKRLFSLKELLSPAKPRQAVKHPR